MEDVAGSSGPLRRETLKITCVCIQLKHISICASLFVSLGVCCCVCESGGVGPPPSSSLLGLVTTAGLCQPLTAPPPPHVFTAAFQPHFYCYIFREEQRISANRPYFLRVRMRQNAFRKCFPINSEIPHSHCSLKTNLHHSALGDDRLRENKCVSLVQIQP